MNPTAINPTAAKPIATTPAALKPAASQPIAVEPMALARLRPFARNARTHSDAQVRQLADSIEMFGFTNPVLIGDDDEIIAGHGRVAAARLLGLQTVPTLRLSGLDEAARRAYVLADNRLALDAGWDRAVLAAELRALHDHDFDIELLGFSRGEIELVLDGAPAVVEPSPSLSSGRAGWGPSPRGRAVEKAPPYPPRSRGGKAEASALPSAKTGEDEASPPR